MSLPFSVGLDLACEMFSIRPVELSNVIRSRVKFFHRRLHGTSRVQSKIDRVVDFVRDARGKFTHRRQAL